MSADRFAPADVASGVERSEVAASAAGIHWLEHRFDEGRACVMHAAGGRAAVAVTPDGVDVGTLAWEYGGGSYLVHGSTVIYSDRDDQRLYRIAAGGSPVALTPAPPAPRADRFADGSPSPDGRWAAYVCESHREGAPVEHRLVAVDLVSAGAPRAPQTLTRGQDFYAAPRIRPDGSALAWITWSKPRMPWDGSELWLAAIGADRRLGAPRRIAGGPAESVVAPEWSPDGALHWVSDRSGWWNLYALRDGAVRALCPERAEYAAPPWQHGRRSYDFLADGTIVAVRIRDAVHGLVRIAAGGGAAQPLPAGYTSITGPHLRCHRESVAFAGATPAVGAAIVSLHVPSGAGATVAAGAPSGDASSASVGVPISVPARDGSAVHGFWYEPARSGRDGRDGRVGRDRRGGGAAVRPPLILHLHGGPTDSARLAFDPELALWTSRGFALLDLDYSGSSGHGSAYRHRLDGAWGRRDLDDCVDAVRHLSAERLVDSARVFARGASAGGYLTLRCVTAASEFTGGMCRCGIADLALWRAHTHDFESRYTDLLVGPASDAGLYRRRSPAAGVGERAAPLLLVHGLADTVVPPEQALLIARSYAAAGRSCALELLPDEPHGLRRAASRRRWLTAELAFVAACAPEAGSP